MATTNFFGITDKRAKGKRTMPAVSFLNISNKNSRAKSNIPKLMAPYLGPSKLYQNKVVFSFVNKKANKKYGDRDFDGTPNKFDCSPNHPGKDGFFSNLMNKATGGRFGQSNEDYRLEKEAKAEKKQHSSEAAKILDKYKSSGETKRRQIEEGLLKATHDKSGRFTGYEKEGVLHTMKDKESQRQAKILSDKRIQQDLKQVKGKTGLMGYLKDKGIYNLEKKTMRVPLYEGKGKNRKKVGYEDVTRTIETGAIPATGKFLSKFTTPVNKIYKQQELRERKAVGANAQTNISNLSRLVGVPLAMGKKGKGTGTKGRPKQSFKYSIPGVGPVGIYEYRKYISARNRAMKYQAKAQLIEAKSMARQYQQQAPSQQETQYMQQQAAEPQQYQQYQEQPQQYQQQQYQQQQQQYQPQEQYSNGPIAQQSMAQPKTYSPYEQQMLASQQPLPQTNAQGPVQGKTGGSILDARNVFAQPTQPQPQAKYQYDLGTTFVARQYPQQQPQPYPQQQPQQPQQGIFKKVDLNTSNGQAALKMVGPGDAPISNASGQAYTDINPMTGQTIMRSRVSEKWLNGEAL